MASKKEDEDKAAARRAARQAKKDRAEEVEATEPETTDEDAPDGTEEVEATEPETTDEDAPDDSEAQDEADDEEEKTEHEEAPGDFVSGVDPKLGMSVLCHLNLNGRRATVQGEVVSIQSEGSVSIATSHPGVPPLLQGIKPCRLEHPAGTPAGTMVRTGWEPVRDEEAGE